MTRRKKREFEGRPLYTEFYNECKHRDIRWLRDNFKEDWLNGLLNYWCARLRIQDWSIDYQWDSPYDMMITSSGRPAQASIAIYPNHSSAEMCICEFSGLHPRTRKYDFELVILHELMHLRLWTWTMQSMTEDELNQHEAVISRLSESLLAEHRDLPLIEFWSNYLTTS